jgi:hypothetical protein
VNRNIQKNHINNGYSVALYNAQWSPRRPLNTMEEKKEETLNEDETSTNEELETETEEVEESNEEDDTPTLEDFNEAKAKLKELEEKNKQLYARLKKGEQSPKTNKTENNDNYLTRDEAILLTKGYDEDDISQLRKIAGDGKLTEAANDPMFIAYRKEKERQERSKKAQLGTSGSVSKGQKPVRDMSEEEHRALFYKSIK